MRRLFPLALVMLTTSIALGSVVPMLPFYVRHMGGSVFMAAAIFSVFSLSSLLTSFFWGTLSDRFGRKRTLLFSTAVTVVSYVWLAYATTLLSVILARVLAGLGGGVLAVSQAYVADVTTPEKRTHGMGLLGGAFGAGFVLGPLLESFIIGPSSAPRFSLAGLVAAGFGTLSFLLILFLLREPQQHHDRQKKAPLIPEALEQKQAFFWLLGVYFIVALVFTGVEGSFAVWGREVFHMGPQDMGLLLAVAGVATALVQGGVVGPLRQRIGAFPLLIFSDVLMGLTLLLMVFTGHILMAYPIIALIAIAHSLHNPVMDSLFSVLAGKNNRGAVMGIVQSTFKLARTFGPSLAGFAFSLGTHYPFLIGAALMIPVVIILLALRRIYPSSARAL